MSDLETTCMCGHTEGEHCRVKCACGGDTCMECSECAGYRPRTAASVPNLAEAYERFRAEMSAEESQRVTEFDEHFKRLYSAVLAECEKALREGGFRGLYSGALRTAFMQVFERLLPPLPPPKIIVSGKVTRVEISVPLFFFAEEE